MSVSNVTREISRRVFEGGATAYSGSGAISPGAGFAAVTTTGTNALTLANGTPGELLMIYLAVDGGDGTLTPATSTGWTTFVFRDVGDSVLLQYISDTIGWIILSTSSQVLTTTKLVSGEGAGACIDRDVQTAAGTALTNSTTETVLSTQTVDGTGLAVGDVIHVVSQGIATATNSTDTLTIKLKVGTEEISTTGAVDVEDDDIWYIDAYITVRAIGSSGKIIGAGIQILDAVGTAPVVFNKAEATEDISGDTTITITGKWSVANAGNSCRSDMFMIEVIR